MLDRSAQRFPRESNKAVLTDVVPTSTPMRNGPFMLLPFSSRGLRLQFVDAMLGSRQQNRTEEREASL